MRTLLLAAGAVLTLAAGAAQATVAIDAKGDFLSNYVGPTTDDLDVTSFSVTYDKATQDFQLGATFAGDIVPGSDGFYVIGINTGKGALAPFAPAPVNRPGVRFDQAFRINKDGTVLAGANVQPFSALISGNSFSLTINRSFLPATIPGFDPGHYGFNIWPRIQTGGLNALADFAPDNSLISAAPEPQSWALMIAGFGLAGGLLRRRQSPAHL